MKKFMSLVLICLLGLSTLSASAKILYGADKNLAQNQSKYVMFDVDQVLLEHRYRLGMMNKKVVIVAGMFIGGSLGYQLLYAKLSGSVKHPISVKQGKSVDERCRFGYALIEAAKGNNLADVQKLVNQGADANFAHALTGNTALHHAAQNGNYKMMYMLIEEGKGNPTLKNKDGQTATDVARENNHENIINLIDSIYDGHLESFARVSA